LIAIANTGGLSVDIGASTATILSKDLSPYRRKNSGGEENKYHYSTNAGEQGMNTEA
jgi:hypothetical protein